MKTQETPKEFSQGGMASARNDADCFTEEVGAPWSVGGIPATTAGGTSHPSRAPRTARRTAHSAATLGVADMPKVWVGINPETYYVKCDECGPIHEGPTAAYAKARAKAHRDGHHESGCGLRRGKRRCDCNMKGCQGHEVKGALA